MWNYRRAEPAEIGGALFDGREKARRRVSRVLSRRGTPKALPLGDGHSSGTPVAERLLRPTRAAARRCARRHLCRTSSAAVTPAAPTWSCSRWGFPCRHRCRRRGALLPHHFTLAARPDRPERAWRYVFCGTVPGVAPAGRYPAPYLRGARTFLSRREAESGRPTVWRFRYGRGRRDCKALRSVARASLQPSYGLVVTPTAAANCVWTLPANSGLTSLVVSPETALIAVGQAM